MKNREAKSRYQLTEIEPFDARRGYKRCSVPGVGCSFARNSEFPRYATSADFWRDRNGRLVVRFSTSQPWDFHFEALLANGKDILERDVEDFAQYIMFEVLAEWDCVDFPPDLE